MRNERIAIFLVFAVSLITPIIGFALSQDKKAYSEKYIQFKDVSAKYFEDILEGRIPGIFGKIQNTGDRTIIELTFTTYFKDKSGRRIFQEQFSPVMEINLTGDNGPLYPGYIRKISYKATGVPAEWNPGSVDFEVTDLKFQGEGAGKDTTGAVSSAPGSTANAFAFLAGFIVIVWLVLIVVLVWFIIVSILLPFRVGKILREARQQTLLLGKITDQIGQMISRIGTRQSNQKDSHRDP